MPKRWRVLVFPMGVTTRISAVAFCPYLLFSCFLVLLPVFRGLVGVRGCVSARNGDIFLRREWGPEIDGAPTSLSRSACWKPFGRCACEA